MRPRDFTGAIREDMPNMGVSEYREVIDREVIILGPDGEYEVLSYYVSNDEAGGCMFLDIQLKET